MTKINNEEKIQFLRTQISILFCLWFIIFIPIYPALFNKWLSDPDNSHGILVPFITGYLIWQKRDFINFTTFNGNKNGLLILILSLIVYLISYAGGIDIFPRLMIVCSLCGLVLFCCGKEVWKNFAFPLLFLFFMVPVPDSIILRVSFPLQIFATKVAHYLIQLVSIPCLRDGNMLYFAETQLEVAEACSGIRSVMAYLMLSFLFAYLMKKNWWKKVIVIFSAIPLALIANIVRVTGTGVIAHFYGGRIARGFLHEFSGIVVFIFGFMLLFIEFLFLNRKHDEH